LDNPLAGHRKRTDIGGYFPGVPENNCLTADTRDGIHSRSKKWSDQKNP
jgi:hypothetical protein